MKLARPVVAAVIVGVVLALVFVVFAVELASGQSRSRNEIKTEVNDRAVLTASLIDSLFGTVQQSKLQYSTDYGSTIDQSKLVTAAQGEWYAVVTDSEGNVLAATPGYQRQQGLAVPPAMLSRLAGQGAAYYLGDLAPYGTSFRADFAVPFPAQSGVRVLITGLRPGALTQFFGSELASVLGARGEVNYLVDGKGRVVAASNSHVPLGSSLARPAATVLNRKSGEANGVYFQQSALDNSSWRVVLVAPSGALFASVNGTREYVPWIIFAALVAVALVAGFLGWRVLRSAEVVSAVNGKLASVNNELTAANRALELRAAELARSNEELDSFASIASHDLQEPLRKVRTFTEQLAVLEGPNLSEKGRDYIVRANSAAERMQRLIEDLLKFSRVSTQGRPFEQVDLAQVARRVMMDLERQVEEAGATVDIGTLPVIAADPLQMQQLLQNLISNAIKFRRPDVRPQVTVRGEKQDGTLVLTVADNGIGFEPKYAARIFRIFERLHGRSEYPGTGIGLSLCRKITDRHGGTIEAQSEPGQGTTFIVALPMTQPEGSFGFGRTAPHREEIEAGATV